MVRHHQFTSSVLCNSVCYIILFLLNVDLISVVNIIFTNTTSTINNKTFRLQQSQSPCHAIALQELITSKQECHKLLPKNYKR